MKPKEKRKTQSHGPAGAPCSALVLSHRRPDKGAPQEMVCQEPSLVDKF